MYSALTFFCQQNGAKPKKKDICPDFCATIKWGLLFPSLVSKLIKPELNLKKYSTQTRNNSIFFSLSNFLSRLLRPIATIELDLLSHSRLRMLVLLDFPNYSNLKSTPKIMTLTCKSETKTEKILEFSPLSCHVAAIRWDVFTAELFWSQLKSVLARAAVRRS